MVNITTLQKYLPLSIKHRLKPYYRLFYPDKLHVVLWITFRCNYRCSYCPIVTQYSYKDTYGRESERPVGEWMEALDKLPSANIYISGGEPFLYSGLPEFVNMLPSKHSILGIVTNATVGIEVYRRIKKEVHLNVSFHREFIEDAAFLRKVSDLKEEFRVCVNIVATPENIPVIRDVQQMLGHKNISLHVDPLVDEKFRYTDEQLGVLRSVLDADRLENLGRQVFRNDYSAKSCTAGRNYINILPNGDVYTCAEGVHYNHSPLYQSILQDGPAAPYRVEHYRMKNLFDGEFSLRERNIVCNLPCGSGCDLDSVVIKKLQTESDKAPIR